MSDLNSNVKSEASVQKAAMMNSLKKPIQIFARLKPVPPHTDLFPYDVEQVENDDTNDQILEFKMKSNQPIVDEGYYVHKQQENQRFRYSKVFDTETSQDEIFDFICKPVIDQALAGYNGTIFAYGQTGSGKTYTMTGSRINFDERGIIPRTLSFIFERFKELEKEMELQTVYISYLEIYNESGYDLLHPSMASGKLDELKKVVLMEDSKQQIHLKHLSVNPVEDEDQAMHLFYMGEHHRTIAETPMNEASTRSHCIFTVHIHTRQINESVVRKSKLHLVDLAGSERVSNTNISGQLFNEARHINLALHYLEQVIVALGDTNRTHIPYRNSMMTSILRDSLGGNCMTSMIATLSLENRNIPETMSTCRFSQRVALVTNDAVLNEEIDPELLIAQLRTEVKRLKAIIASASVKPMSLDAAPLTENEFEQCCNAVQTFIQDPSEDSVLMIAPDMRLIQKCFQILKLALNETEITGESGSGIDNNNNSLQTSGVDVDQRQKQLMNALAARDHEIKVLSKMLKEVQDRNKLYEQTMGKQPSEASSSARTLPPDSNRSNTSGGSGKPKKKGFPNIIPNAEVSKKKILASQHSPLVASAPLIDKEMLVLEGFSEEKKTAWYSFLDNSTEKENLYQLREDLVKRRNVAVKIKDEMNKDHETLKLLKRSMMTAVSQDELELNNTVFKEAVDDHEKKIAKKEHKLKEATEAVDANEVALRCMYSRIAEDFEKSFENSNATKTTAKAMVKELTAPVSSKRDGYRICTVRSFGTDLQFLQQSWTEETSNGSLNVIGSSRSKKSGRKSKNKSKGKTPVVSKSSSSNRFNIITQPLQTNEVGEQSIEIDETPGIISSRSRSRSKVNTASASVGSKPKSRKGLVTASQKGLPALDAPLSVPSHSSRGDTKMDLPSLPNTSRDGEPGDLPPQNLIEECPMTGDPVCDREILNFIRKRQAVFRKIQEEKMMGRSLQSFQPEEDLADVTSISRSEP